MALNMKSELIKGRVGEEQQQVDSFNGGLHFLWLAWRIVGINPPSTHRRLYSIYAASLIFFSGICFPISLLVNIIATETFEKLVANLNISFTIFNCCCKQLVIWLGRDQLLSVCGNLRELDERCNRHAEDRQHIRRAIRTCHSYYLGFGMLYTVSALGNLVIGMRSHNTSYDGWFPQLFANAEYNFFAVFWYQNLCILTYYILNNVTNDTYSQCYVAIVVAHIRALARRITCIGKDTRMSADENYAEMLACIRDHKNILSYLTQISTPISRTLALQFLTTACVLCLIGIRFTTYNDLDKLLNTATYLVAVLLESFPICWFVNSLIQESDLLTTALYSCNWYEQDHRFRKTLIIFMQRSQKKNVLNAANLAPITLQTYIQILKFSFSLFTLLNQMK